MTFSQAVYKKAQELIVLAMEHDNKKLLAMAINLGIFADKLKNEKEKV